MAGRQMMPAPGLIGLAQGLHRPSHPIGAAGTADGILNGPIHGHKMVQGDFGIVEKPKRDPARQPFGLGEGGAGFKPVILG